MGAWQENTPFCHVVRIWGKEKCKMKNLFVIGNGFDLYHKIPSSYGGYREYLLKKGLKWIVDFFDRSFFSFDLPEELTKVHKGIAECGNDLQKRGRLLAANFGKLVSSSFNTWRCIEIVLGCINGIRGEEGKMTIEFAEIITSEISNWMKEEIEPTIPSESTLKLPSEDSSYLTFNYTDTLEKSCKISSENIIHIHNKIGEKLLFGHTNYEAIRDCSSGPMSVPDCEDPVIRACLEKTANEFNSNQYLLNYYKTTLKDVSATLEKNRGYFDSLANIENVYVLGHSLSSVDYVYFDAINKIAPNAQWLVSYYDDSAKQDIEDTPFFRQIKDKVTFKTWPELERMFG